MLASMKSKKRPAVGMENIFGHLFLSAGAMKSGTTWLFSVLRHHPKLHCTLEKEIHYFYHRYVDNSTLCDKRRLERARKYCEISLNPRWASADKVRMEMRWVSNFASRPVDDLWYQALFTRNHHQLFGCDFSNLYALLPADAWPQIEEKCNKLRVLYTMRHPIHRLWSQVKFSMQMDGDLDILKDMGPRKIRKYVKGGAFWSHAEYGEAIRRMKAGLSKDAFKVIFFENLHDDKQGTLVEIEDFLNIEHHNFPPNLLDRIINESISVPMPEFFPELFAKDAKRICDEVEAEGFELPKTWRE